MYTEHLEEKVICPQRKEDILINKFLARFGMHVNQEAEYTFALLHHEQVVATGSLTGNQLCSIAVDPEFRDNGLFAKVVTHLIHEASRRGHFRYLAVAEPHSEKFFLSLGFRKLETVKSYTSVLALGLELESAAIPLP